MAMDQYLYIRFLEGWTSIYQLFWCSPGVQGFDPSPYIYPYLKHSCSNDAWELISMWPAEPIRFVDRHPHRDGQQNIKTHCCPTMAFWKRNYWIPLCCWSNSTSSRTSLWCLMTKSPCFMVSWCIIVIPMCSRSKSAFLHGTRQPSKFWTPWRRIHGWLRCGRGWRRFMRCGRRRGDADKMPNL